MRNFFTLNLYLIKLFRMVLNNMVGETERKCYYYEYFPNDIYVREYGMCYRNFIRILPLIDNDRYSKLFKTMSICLILNADIFENYVNYLKFISTDIYKNINDSYTAFSVKKHIDNSINIFLKKHGINSNKPNMFYEDSFLLISHECQNMQNCQVEHLMGKTINGITIKKMSDIICYPHSYFESFEKTVKDIKRPKNAISIKFDYIANTLDGKIKDTSFEDLVNLILKISQEIYNSLNCKSHKGLEIFLYVKHRIESFLVEESFNIKTLSNVFYDECFLVVVYKIQEELESKQNVKEIYTNKTSELNNKKSATNNGSISKTASYILATVSCIIIFFIYQIVAVIVFEWKRGGGLLPMFILFSALVWFWKWIVSFSKVKRK